MAVSPARVRIWCKWYREPDPVEKIQKAFKISLQANQRIDPRRRETKREVVAAINQVVGLNSTKATVRGTELIRFSKRFVQSDIDRACLRLKKHSHDNQGITLSHLLILTRVANEDARKELLSRSILQGWTTIELKKEVRGLSNWDMRLRPAQFAQSTQASADTLIELLEQVKDKNFASSTKSVRSDLENCRDKLKSCLKSLRKLKKCLIETEPIIAEAREGVSKRLKQLPPWL